MYKFFSKTKYLIVALLAVTLLFAMSCSDSIKLKDNPPSDAVVENNGGSVVKKGDYYYVINGSGDTTTSNKYGTPTSGAIYRMRLDANETVIADSVELVVPKMILSNATNVDTANNTGIFIVGDYIYYLTPSLEEDKRGNLLEGYVDLFKVKIDGSKNKKLYTFSSNISQAKFVEIDGSFYYVYVEDYVIYKINSEGKRSVLQTVESSVLFGDDNRYYFSKPIKKISSVTENEKEEYESYQEIWSGSMAGGKTTCLIAKDNPIVNTTNAQTGEKEQYSLSLTKVENGILYYAKTIETISKQFAFDLTSKQEYQLPSNDATSVSKYLGFNGTTNTQYITQINSKTYIVSGTVDAPTFKEIYKGTPQILTIDTETCDMLFIEDGELFAYNYANYDDEILSTKKISIFSFTTDTYPPEIIGDFFFAMSSNDDDENFLFTNYIYAVSITKMTYAETDTKFTENLTKPQLFGKLSEYDAERLEDLIDAAEEDDENLEE